MPVNMKKCPKCGCFYDGEKSGECPFCKGEKLDKNMTFNVTERLERNTVPPSAPQPEETAEEPEPAPAPEPAPSATAPEPAPSATAAPGPVNTDPVVGWLVVMNGKDKGRSYTLHSDNNFIGRSSKMDVRIEGDESVCEDNHAFVTYDSRDRIFYLTPGEVRSIVRNNGKPVLQPAELKAKDRMEIGSTVLMFIPLCDESFDWESEGK